MNTSCELEAVRVDVFAVPGQWTEAGLSVLLPSLLSLLERRWHITSGLMGLGLCGFHLEHLLSFSVTSTALQHKQE